MEGNERKCEGEQKRRIGGKENSGEEDEEETRREKKSREQDEVTKTHFLPVKANIKYNYAAEGAR